MKLLNTLVFLLAAGQASAFDLQSINTERIAALGIEAPAAQKGNIDTPEAAYALIKEYYHGVSYPVTPEFASGTWEGRIFLRDPQGYREARPIRISFTKKIIPSELGPLFQDEKEEIFIQFPYYEGLLERRVTFDPKDGMSFQFRWDKNFTVTFRRMNHGNSRVLLLRSDCYDGDTYAYLIHQKNPSKQAYTGALPAGDLFGPLPPYFHGQMPPLQANGQAVQGAYEYSNRIIFYKDQGQAQAAAEKAADALRAAGLEVLSVKAEELNGFYYTSVGFAGKRAILYRWDDDAPTAEKAAEIIKRKTDRYASEGYTILETNINKAGDKHFFFIMCAKFF